MAKVCVVFAHPYPQRSQANSALLAALDGVPDLDVRSLYALYPDFGIDVATEQTAITEAESIVWQCPFYWYGMPSLLVHWIEKVLARGFAYDGGRAMEGKRLFWVTTTGAPDGAYQPGQLHGHTFDTFVPHISQTAKFCGMTWEEPLIVHHARHLSAKALAKHGETYRKRVLELVGGG